MSDYSNGLDDEFIEALVTKHGSTVGKWLKKDKTIGEAYKEANREAKAELTKLMLEERMHEWESMSWHKDHPPTYSGHDSGTITMKERMAELQEKMNE